MTTPDQTIRDSVRSRYGAIALTGSPCCSPGHDSDLPSGDPSGLTGSPCCSPGHDGYDPADLAELPEGAVMGLGCGNPVAEAGIAPGETVLDLGSGGGIDVFLAARHTGGRGRVIGVDMTPEMLRRAEANASAAGLTNVEFRHGTIEDLPVAGASVDVILSNCVINLSPDKPAVFAEAFRVLRPGGRLVVADIVRNGPATRAADPRTWASCIDGALPLDDYLGAIDAAGFERVEVLRRDGSGEAFSVTVRAVKP